MKAVSIKRNHVHNCAKAKQVFWLSGNLFIEQPLAPLKQLSFHVHRVESCSEDEARIIAKTEHVQCQSQNNNHLSNLLEFTSVTEEQLQKRWDREAARIAHYHDLCVLKTEGLTWAEVGAIYGFGARNAAWKARKHVGYCLSRWGRGCASCYVLARDGGSPPYTLWEYRKRIENGLCPHIGWKSA